MFDLAIVGSGYGGAVLAGRLASSARVLLVERGLRYRAGEFPSSSIGLARRYLTRKNPLGLWEMRLGKGTGNALVSAYGGASVVNYGITSQPERHVFDDWPIAFSTLEPYFERAKAELGASINPVASELGDQQFLDRMEPGRRVDLENTIDWTRCTQCGDCPLGCNLGAKRSLDTTYLARAEEAGVTLALGQTLVALTRDESDTHWRLSLRRTDGGTPVGIEARRVVLASGTFGTLDLLNSWRDSLPTTAAFGQRVSMNGDGLAFLYNTRHRLSGHHGAPITTSVRLPFIAPDGSTRSLMVMSGRIPKSIMRFSSAVLAVFSNLLPGQARARARAR
jgi:cholesterol oxidase